MNQFKDKLKLTVYSHSDECPISHNDLSVYSYLLFQDRYREGEGYRRPSYKKTAFKTGLNEKTVSDSVLRLTARGLINEDGDPILPGDKADWFRHKRPTGPHPSQALHYRSTYVRNPQTENGLSVAATSVYSYVRIKGEENFVPESGWSKGYLAKCLHLDPGTVVEALRSLASHGLLEFDDEPFAIRLQPILSAAQLRLFADNVDFKEQPKAKGTVSFLPIKADNAMVAPQESAIAPAATSKYNLAEGLKRVNHFIEDEVRKKLGGNQDVTEDEIKGSLARFRYRPDLAYKDEAAIRQVGGVCVSQILIAVAARKRMSASVASLSRTE